MRHIRCVCRGCGNQFLWTHEERIAAVKAFEPENAFDTRSFKIETGRMKKPLFCGECRVRSEKKRAEPAE
jgi:hypothetical protein